MPKTPSCPDSGSNESQAEQIGHWQNWQTNQIQNSSRQIQRICQCSYETGPLSSPHLNNRTGQSPSWDYPNNPNNFSYEKSVFKYKLVRALDGPGCQPTAPPRPERRPPILVVPVATGTCNLLPKSKDGTLTSKERKGVSQSFHPSWSSYDLRRIRSPYRYEKIFFRYERTAKTAKKGFRNAPSTTSRQGPA